MNAMRISLKSMMFLVVCFGMGTSIVLVDRERNRLKQQRDVVIEINQDLTEDHERMKVLFDVRTKEVKRLRDENGTAIANADSAQRQVKQLTTQLKTERQKADQRLDEAIKTGEEAYENELNELTAQNDSLKKELASLKAVKEKGAQ
jgi:hypothetical protein